MSRFFSMGSPEDIVSDLVVCLGDCVKDVVMMRDDLESMDVESVDDCLEFRLAFSGGGLVLYTGDPCFDTCHHLVCSYSTLPLDCDEEEIRVTVLSCLENMADILQDVPEMDRPVLPVGWESFLADKDFSVFSN